MQDLVKDFDEALNINVGEKGLKISGGQKQRIGIARALYREPKILILDEATSALDNKTQKNIFELLLNLKKDLTIINVSHKKEFIEISDQIIEL